MFFPFVDDALHFGANQVPDKRAQEIFPYTLHLASAKALSPFGLNLSMSTERHFLPSDRLGKFSQLPLGRLDSPARHEISLSHRHH